MLQWFGQKYTLNIKVYNAKILLYQTYIDDEGEEEKIQNITMMKYCPKNKKELEKKDQERSKEEKHIKQQIEVTDKQLSQTEVRTFGTLYKSYN